MEEKKLSLREKLASLVFIVIIGVFFILNFVIPEPEVLVSERRVPAKFPEFSADSVLSADFMSKFEEYAADRFVFRDTFREIHAFIIFDIFRQSDMSGLYRSRAVGVGEFRRIDTASFNQAADKIKKAAASLDGPDMNIYYSVIPDKSIFAEKYMPGFDLSGAEEMLSGVLSEYQYIPLGDILNADSFYKTDIHWNQVKVQGAAQYILSAMGAVSGVEYYASYPVENHTDYPAEIYTDYPVEHYPILTAGEFRGVYAGQIAMPVAAETLTYLDIPDLKVSYLNENTLEFEGGPLYDPEQFTGIDPYNIFLRGPQPLIVIENEAVPTRELYLFRDSFGSSFAPLLTNAYSKITVIDLRYINLEVLNQFVDFKPGSDVLFLYSSQIFNNPSILQIP